MKLHESENIDPKGRYILSPALIKTSGLSLRRGCSINTLLIDVAIVVLPDIVITAGSDYIQRQATIKNGE